MTPSITKDSICWPTVETTSAERIESIRADLETAPPDKVTGLQAEIRAFRWLLMQAETPAPLPLWVDA